MPRPRNTKVKLVLELPDITYQRLAVRAYQLAKSVDTLVRDVVERETDALVGLPLLEARVPAQAPAPPAPPVVEEVKKGTKK